MKPLLIITTIFLSSLMMASVANAKWTEVGKNVSGNTYYVDFERIKKHNGRVYYWYLHDRLKPTSEGTMSSKIYSEVECGRLRDRFLNQFYYNGPMASGEIIHSDSISEKDWDYPSPDSVSEFILKAVCNHKN
jgi:hypothetical protein